MIKPKYNLSNPVERLAAGMTATLKENGQFGVSVVTVDNIELGSVTGNLIFQYPSAARMLLERIRMGPPSPFKEVRSNE